MGIVPLILLVAFGIMFFWLLIVVNVRTKKNKNDGREAGMNE